MEASALEPMDALGFLHENYTAFIDDGAVGDVALATSYLSDAALLLSTRSLLTESVHMEVRARSGGAAAGGPRGLARGCAGPNSEESTLLSPPTRSPGAAP